MLQSPAVRDREQPAALGLPDTRVDRGIDRGEGIVVGQGASTGQRERGTRTKNAGTEVAARQTHPILPGRAAEGSLHAAAASQCAGAEANAYLSAFPSL